MRHDVVTIGEAMLRLSPPNGASLTKATTLDLDVAGSEANTAVCLASLGRSVAWLSSLPDNRLGRRVIRDLRAADVDVSGVSWVPGGRLGIYYVELDDGPRGVSVIYDRTGAAASRMTSADIDMSIISAARIVHLTGITPSLSPSCREMILEVAAVVRDSSALLSVDVNYRSRLWEPAEAGQVMSKVAQGADLVVCTLEDARDVFGIAEPSQEAAPALAGLLDVRTVVVTRGTEGAVLHSGSETTVFAATPTMVRDRLGAGDAFAAGLLDGVLDDDIKRGMEQGSVLAACALATPGDHVDISRSELDALMPGKKRSVDR